MRCGHLWPANAQAVRVRHRRPTSAGLTFFCGLRNPGSSCGFPLGFALGDFRCDAPGIAAGIVMILLVPCAIR